MNNTLNIKKIAILCGGTGGHFFPGLTIAREFAKEGNAAALITGGHKKEYQQEAAEQYQLDIFQIPAAKISKKPAGIIKFLFFFFCGFIKSIIVLRKYKPSIILAMGSYTSLPTALAAFCLRIKLFLHDGNALVGKANIFLSYFAKLLMASFPVVNSKKIKCKIEITGMPLRTEIVNTTYTKDNAISEINHTFKMVFNPNILTILIFGGSQGAKAINTLAPEVIKASNTQIQVIHLTGKTLYLETKKIYENNNIRSIVLESYDNMSLFYSASDLVICRSGGSTISELEYFQKKAILIPYPHATDNHQLYNAQYYVKKGYAEIIEEKDCSVQSLLAMFNKMLTIKPAKELKVTSDTAVAKILKNIYSEL